MKPVHIFPLLAALLLGNRASAILQPNVTTFHAFSAANVPQGTIAIIPATKSVADND